MRTLLAIGDGILVVLLLIGEGCLALLLVVFTHNATNNLRETRQARDSAAVKFNRYWRQR